MANRLELPRSITLRMQQSDIDSAVCRSRQHCAIAQTIYRQCNLAFGRVRVTAAGVTIAKGDYRYYYKVPEIAVRLVRDFDNGKPVKPIIFRLRLSYRNKIWSVDPERKHGINQARREREAALAAQGLKPKTYSVGRYMV